MGDERFIGTASGVYRQSTGRRLTPSGQICSNHITAMVSWNGDAWFGSFRDGICVRRGAEFQTLAAPFRMVNDLEPTPFGLFVAASEGLFVTTDGRSFDPVPGERREGANGVAFDGRSLWATTPGALWRIRVGGRGPSTRVFWRPGGARAVQDVAVHDGIVWLATEDRGAVRFDGSEHTVFDRAAGLPTSWGLKIAVDAQGTAYMATLRHGIVVIDGAGARPLAVPDAWLFNVSVVDGEVWASTQGGAYRVTGADAPAFPLPDPRVHVVARLDGRLHVGTESGLAIE
jgi:ligand-binding sensor domain-containing protein